MNELKFIQVGELAKGISENLLPDSDTLSGKTLEFSFENASTTRIRSHSSYDLSWEIIEGPDKGSSGQETYRATNIRENICLVDYVSQTLQATSISMVIDLKTKVAIWVVGALPDAAETEKDAFSRASEGLELTTVSRVP
jgi:hypothetical protein